MNKFSFFFSLILILIVSGCSGSVEKGLKSYESNSDELTIFTTVYPLKYFSERIGGSHVNVESVYPAGSDEHSFEPTQRDMMNLADSDLFFYIGLGLEGFVDKASGTLKNENVKLVSTSEFISEDLLKHIEEDEEDEEAHDGHGSHGNSSFIDPHVWLSPLLSIDLAFSIKESLIEISPEFSDDYEREYLKLKEELLELDRNYKKMGENALNKSFLISHASFGYIEKFYGLKQVSVSGLNSQSEPSQKGLANLVKSSKDQNLNYILFEQNVSSKLGEVVKSELDLDSLYIHNLSVLTVENEKNNDDYFSLMNRNLDVFKKVTGK